MLNNSFQQETANMTAIRTGATLTLALLASSPAMAQEGGAHAHRTDSLDHFQDGQPALHGRRT
jgi:hypothetical protein